MRVTYDRLFSSDAGREEGSRYQLGAQLPQLIEPSRYAPELTKTQFVANARAIATQLFGDDLEPEFGEHMIYKPALVGSETPWHQDQAYHDPGLRYRNINFWLPLDDATVESGCMQFVPGSNRLDLVPHGRPAPTRVRTRSSWTRTPSIGTPSPVRFLPAAARCTRRTRSTTPARTAPRHRAALTSSCSERPSFHAKSRSTPTGSGPP